MIWVGFKEEVTFKLILEGWVHKYKDITETDYTHTCTCVGVVKKAVYDKCTVHGIINIV